MLPTIQNTSKKKKEVEKPKLFFNFTNQGLSLDDRNSKSPAGDTSRTVDTARNSDLEQYTIPSHPMNWQTHRDTPWGQCVEVISSRKKGWIDRFASQLDESCIIETKTIEEMKEEKLKESGWTNIKIPYSSLSPPKVTRKKDSFKKFPFSADRMTTCVTCLASVNKNIEVVGCIRCDVVIHLNCIKDVQRYLKKKPVSTSSSATSTASSSSFIVDNIGGGGGGGAKRRRTNQNSTSVNLSSFASINEDNNHRPYTAPAPNNNNSHNHNNNSLTTTTTTTTATTNIIKSKDLEWLCDFCEKDSIINSIYFEKKQHFEKHQYNRLLACIRLQAFYRMSLAKLNFYKFRHGIIIFQQVIRMRKFAKLAELERINQHYVFKIRLHELKILSLDSYYSTITDSNMLEKLILPFPIRRYPYLIGKISSTKYEKALLSFLNKQHSLASYIPPVTPANTGDANSSSCSSNSQPASNNSSNNAIQMTLNQMKEQKQKQDQQHQPQLVTAGRVSFREVLKPSSATASSEVTTNNKNAGNSVYPGSPPPSANPFFTTASASVRFNVQPDNNGSLSTARSLRSPSSRALTPNKNETHSLFGDDCTVGDDTTTVNGEEEDKEQELFDLLFQGGTYALENPAYVKPYREMQILMKGTLFLTVTVYEHHVNDSTMALEATTSAHNQIFSNTTSTQSVINLLEANFADPYYSASIQTYRYDVLLKHNNSITTTKLKPDSLLKMGYSSSEFDLNVLEKLCKIYNLDSYVSAKSLLLIPYSHANVTIKFTLSEVSDWPKATVIGQSSFHPQHFIVRKKVISLHQDILSSSKLTNEDLPISEDGGKLSLQLPKNYTVSSAYNASGRRMTLANIAATASDEHSLLHPKDLQSKAVAKTAKNLLSPVQETIGKRKFSQTGRNPMKLIDVKYPILSWTFLASYKNEGHDYGFLMILNPVSSLSLSL
jgi:hypothetical protein